MSGPSSHDTSLDDPDVWVPYRYQPTVINAVVFIAAFAIITLLHSFQLLKTRTYYLVFQLVGNISELPMRLMVNHYTEKYY